MARQSAWKSPSPQFPQFVDLVYEVCLSGEFRFLNAIRFTLERLSPSDNTASRGVSWLAMLYLKWPLDPEPLDFEGSINRKLGPCLKRATGTDSLVRLRC